MTRTNHNTNSDPSNLSRQDRTTLSSNSRATAQHRLRIALSERIAATGLVAERFVSLCEGTKKSRVDHTNPEHQHFADELDGNCGVMAGDGLVIVDIDNYDGSEVVPDAIKSLPPTFTVETPHGGEHRYYAVDDPVDNSQNDWGEIRATDQYVVGPGSVLDSCSKSWHDCSDDGSGRYAILDDRPLAQIAASALPAKSKDRAETRTEGDLSNAPELTDLNDVAAPFDRLKTRLQAFLNDEKRRALWEGRYSEADFDDRSRAEGALAYHLGWFFEEDSSVVSQLMTLSCRQYPMTDSNTPRKWLIRDDDSYRQNTVKLPDYDNTYTPSWSGLGPRPEVSQVTSNRVLVATHELYPATVDEITNHSSVDVGREQTRKALEELRDSEFLSREKDMRRPGNPYVYYPAFEDEIDTM